MNDGMLNKEIDWFCHHAVSENLFDAASCLAVLDAIKEADMEPELALFMQVILDNQICQDAERLQTLAQMAKEEAKILGYPPTSVFESSQTAPNEPVEPAQSPEDRKSVV